MFLLNVEEPKQQDRQIQIKIYGTHFRESFYVVSNVDGYLGMAAIFLSKPGLVDVKLLCRNDYRIMFNVF